MPVHCYGQSLYKYRIHRAVVGIYVIVDGGLVRLAYGMDYKAHLSMTQDGPNLMS